MKEYRSAEDVRVWSDNVEQRRQQILEYQAKSKGAGAGPCSEKIVPLEKLFDAVVSMKDEEIKDREKELKRLEKILGRSYKTKLNSAQQKKFDKLKAKLDEEFSDIRNTSETST